MKLKTALLAAAIAATGLLATSANADQYSGPDGTINITGKVVAQTCQVANGGTVSVTLAPVLASALATSGNTVGDKSFDIAITGCDTSLSTVQASFSGGNINANGRLSNTGSASNVDVQMLASDDSSVLDLSGANGTAQGTSAVNLDSSGAATLTYYARYYATGTAGAGSVNSTVDFTLTYN